jgi:hypothetical protein
VNASPSGAAATPPPLGLRYEVTATGALDLPTSRLALSTSLLVATPAGGLDSLTLSVVARAYGAWSGTKITVDGVPVQPVWTNTIGLVVTFPVRWAGGSRHVLRIEGLIDAAKSSDTMGYLRRTVIGGSTVFAAGDFLPLPMPAPRWPVFANPLNAVHARSITFTVTTSSPLDAAGVIMPGRRIGGPATGVGSRWSYRLAPARSFALVVAPGYGVSRKTIDLSAVGGPRAMEISSYGVNRLVREADLAAAAISLRELTRRFGAGPYDSLRIVTTETGGYAHKYPGLILMGRNFTLGAARNHIVAHEMAHAWWYDLVAPDEGSNSWMNETLAEWSAQRLDGRTTAASAGDCTKPIDGPSYKTAGYYSRFFGPNNYYECVYKRGTALLMAVGRTIGFERLESCLRAYAQGNRFRSPGPRELLGALTTCDRRVFPILRPYFSAQTLATLE